MVNVAIMAIKTPLISFYPSSSMKEFPHLATGPFASVIMKKSVYPYNLIKNTALMQCWIFTIESSLYLFSSGNAILKNIYSTLKHFCCLSVFYNIERRSNDFSHRNDCRA